jgi:H+/Cl- antiporter ClcA
LNRLLEAHPWSPWILSPLGFALIAYLTRSFFRGAEGSGIPQTIFALQSHATDRSAQLLTLRVVIGRALLTGAGLLCGGSIGREGPTVHVGAALAHGFGRWMPHGRMAAKRRVLILAGGAAGVAAAFNTPLAGIVFAIEELSRSFEESASGAALMAVILAGIVSIALMGDYAYFGQAVVLHSGSVISASMLALGLLAGIAGGLFSRLILIGVGGLPGIVAKL